MYTKPPASRTFLLAHPDLEAAALDVDGLVAVVVHVQRRPSVRRDLADEVVDRAAGVLARDLEDQVPARTRRKTHSLV